MIKDLKSQNYGNDLALIGYYLARLKFPDMEKLFIFLESEIEENIDMIFLNCLVNVLQSFDGHALHSNKLFSLTTDKIMAKSKNLTNMTLHEKVTVIKKIC